MSANMESVVVPSEPVAKKPAEGEMTVSNDNKDSRVKENDCSSVSAVNGALPEEAQSDEGKTKNEANVTTNGLENKAAPAHREVPGLLPLQPLQIQIGQLPVSSQTPVVATKSAPPPVPSTPPKTPSPPVSHQKGKDANDPSPQKPSAKNETSDEPSTEKRKGRKRQSRKVEEKSEDDDSQETDDAGRKSKRTRTQTRPFQSSDMDATLLRALKATAAAAASAQQQKAYDDKLVVFFKGEFLAVRNAEGGFYVCQAMQNIYRGSHKIKIRWLSEIEKAPEKTDELQIYSPDFYDHTDFECILTNLDLEKVGKDKYGLPSEERHRAENILKRALDVETGVAEKVEVTEEHPDGLDVSLLHDESQLTRKKRGRRKAGDDSSSESEPKFEPESGTSGSSAQPEPTASGSSGERRSVKRTRAAAVAAAARRSAQYYDDDEDEDDMSSEEEAEAEQDEDETSSESELDRAKRRRSSPRTKPVRKTQAKRRRSSRRAKKAAVTPKTKPLIQSKAALKEHPPISEEKLAEALKTPAKSARFTAKTPKPAAKKTPKGRKGRKSVRGKRKEESDEEEEMKEEMDEEKVDKEEKKEQEEGEKIEKTEGKEVSVEQEEKGETEKPKNEIADKNEVSEVPLKAEEKKNEEVNEKTEPEQEAKEGKPEKETETKQ